MFLRVRAWACRTDGHVMGTRLTGKAATRTDDSSVVLITLFATRNRPIPGLRSRSRLRPLLRGNTSERPGERRVRSALVE